MIFGMNSLFFGCVQQSRLAIRSLLGSGKCRLSYAMYDRMERQTIVVCDYVTFLQACYNDFYPRDAS